MNFINLIQYSKEVLNDENYLFKDIILPIGIDKEILVNTIMDACALATPLYNYPKLLKSKIDNLFKKNYDIYDRLLKAFNAEYDPISNYDRLTEINDESNIVSNLNSNNLTDVSAYDSNEYEHSDRINSTSDGNQLNTFKHSERSKGNIGVITSQKMLESELKVRPKLNIYEVIANDFYNELMLYIQ